MPTFPGSPYFYSCDEIWSGRRATPWDGTDSLREYTRRFRVITRMNIMEAQAVIHCPGLPRPWTFYVASGEGARYRNLGTELKEVKLYGEVGFDLLSLLHRYTVEQEHEDDWQNHIVTCEYTTKVSRQLDVNGQPVDANKVNQDPTLEPPKIAWERENIKQSLQTSVEGADGLGLMNSAQDPFVPSPEFDISVPVLTMTRNETNYSASLATAYAYALNNAPFLGAPVGAAQSMAPTAEEIFKGTFNYWKVNYKIRFAVIKPDGTWLKWQPRILDQGYNQWIKEDGVWHYREIIDPKTSRQVTTPKLLDGAGKLKVANSLGYITPFFLNYNIYKYVDMSGLLVYGMNT